MFELIHSDLWTSPVTSLSGFKYYVLFLYDFSHFYGYFLYVQNQMLLLSSKTFVHMSQTSLKQTYNFSNVIMAVNSTINLFWTCLTHMALKFDFHALTHPNKMEKLNALFALLITSYALPSFKPHYHPNSGLRPFFPLCILSIYFLPPPFSTKPRLNYCLVLLPPTLT